MINFRKHKFSVLSLLVLLSCSMAFAQAPEQETANPENATASNQLTAPKGNTVPNSNYILSILYIRTSGTLGKELLIVQIPKKVPNMHGQQMPAMGQQAMPRGPQPGPGIENHGNNSFGAPNNMQFQQQGNSKSMQANGTTGPFNAPDTNKAQDQQQSTGATAQGPSANQVNRTAGMRGNITVRIQQRSAGVALPQQGRTMPNMQQSNFQFRQEMTCMSMGQQAGPRTFQAPPRMGEVMRFSPQERYGSEQGNPMQYRTGNMMGRPVGPCPNCQGNPPAAPQGNFQQGPMPGPHPYPAYYGPQYPYGNM
ncbi:MAG: hypothetical protein LKE40_00660 [Spirochaetia bacterium]|jgi:hypothetical protein|nr:hypothetical protein [Spirochaetia bacterium]